MWAWPSWSSRGAPQERSHEAVISSARLLRQSRVLDDLLQFGVQGIGQQGKVGEVIGVGDHRQGQGAGIGQRLELDGDVAVAGNSDGDSRGDRETAEADRLRRTPHMTDQGMEPVLMIHVPVIAAQAGQRPEQPAQHRDRGGPAASALRARTMAATCLSRVPTCPVAGTGTSMGLTMLPKALPLPALRPETGTATTIRSVDSPLAASTRRSAPATATTTASLVVAPCWCTPDRNAAAWTRTTASLRRGPVRWFSEQGVARGG